jgi:hypothetical protein
MRQVALLAFLQNAVASGIMRFARLVARDELEPVMADFCDRLSNPSLTDTRLDDDSFQMFRTKLSQAIIDDYQERDAPLQWKDVGEALQNVLSECAVEAFYPRNEARFLLLNDYAALIKGADYNDIPVDIHLGSYDYSPMDFILKMAACENTRDVHNAFLDKSQSPLSKPVFLGGR